MSGQKFKQPLKSVYRISSLLAILLKHYLKTLKRSCTGLRMKTLTLRVCSKSQTRSSAAHIS